MAKVTIREVRAHDPASLNILVFGPEFVERANELGRQFGIAREEGETYIRYAARLVAAQRLPAPQIAGLLA